MFIIQCHRDNSYCKVDDKNVVFDKSNPPNESDEVYFYYNNVKEQGQVILKSDEMSVIDSTFHQLKKKLKSRKLSSSSDDDKETVNLPHKRSRRVSNKYSSESYETLDFTNQKKPKNDLKQDFSKKQHKTGGDEIHLSIKQENLRTKGKKSTEKDPVKKLKKKAADLIQSSIEQKIVDTKEMFTEELSSPSKDELKLLLEETRKQLALAKNSSAAGSLKESESLVGKKLLKKSKQIHINDSRTESEGESDDDTNVNACSGNDKDDSLDHSTNSKETKNIIPDDESRTCEVIKNDRANEPTSSDEKDLIEDTDLYGKDWAEEKMEKLMDQIYCKKSEYDLARALSSQATHVARRLITGVFKPSGYLNATFTGQSPRAHKPEQPQQIKPLNEVARNEIIDFALKLASLKKWKTRKGVTQTRGEIERAMSQRVGELKRSHQLNKQKNDLQQK